eukprot:291045_1
MIHRIPYYRSGTFYGSLFYASSVLSFGNPLSQFQCILLHLFCIFISHIGPVSRLKVGDIMSDLLRPTGPQVWLPSCPAWYEPQHSFSFKYYFTKPRTFQCSAFHRIVIDSI